MAEGSPSPGFTAVVTGGTGAIGHHLVAELLGSPAWSRVTVVGRRAWTQPASSGVDAAAAEASGRLVQRQVDMQDVLRGQHGELFAGHDASFCVLGTTHGQAGSAAAFREVDHGLVAAVARLSKAGGASFFAHVTAAGTGSWWGGLSNYSRTKAAAEASILEQAFPCAVVLRPGLLDRGDAARGMEKLALKLLPSVPVAAVARAMRLQAERALTELKAGGAGAAPGFTVVEDAAIPRQLA